jgi:hypothetical protein
MAREELIIDVKADIGDADKDLTRVRNKVDDLDDATQGAGKSAGGFFGGIGGGVAKLGLMATGIGAVVSGGGALVGFFTDAAKAAGEEQVGIERLNQTLKNSVPGWDGNSAAIEAYIGKQEALAFADDELRDSLGFLVGQTKDLNEAQSLQAAAMDLARAKNISLEQATKAVAKVDNESIGILKKLGIEVTENMTKEEALAAIRTASAGQAEVYANSMQGSMERVGNAFDNAKETIGGAIMNGIQPLLSGLATFISGPEFQGFIQGASEAIGAAFQAIGAVVGTVWGFIQGTIIPIAQAVFGELQKWWTEIEPEVTAAWQAIEGAIRDAWNFIEPLLREGLAFLKTLWEAVWPGIQATFEGVWTAIQGVLQVGWAVIEGIWNTVTSILKGDWEGAWNAIKKMFEGVWKGVETFLSGVWDTIKGIWEAGTAYLGTLWETAWSGIKGFFESTWKFISEDLPKKLGEIWAAITNWIGTTASDLGTKAVEMGKAMLDGIVEGIKGLGAALWDFISGIASDIWNNLVNFFTGGGGGGGGGDNPPGKALGGPVSRGFPYIVGERGPELFVPAMSGSIIPNHDLPTGARPGEGISRDSMATRPATAPIALPVIDLRIENRDGALMPQTVRVISRALQLDRTLTVTGAR